MKKIILSIAAAAVFCFAANAQIFVNAGYLQDDIRLSGLPSDIGGIGQCITLKGFQLGASYNYDLPFGFGVEAGLNFAKEFRKLKMGSEGTIDATALSLPILCNIKHEFSPAVKLLAYAGPEFRYIFDAKAKSEGETRSVNEERKILGHFEVRAALGIGVQLFEQIRIDAGYRLGLNNFAGKDARDEDIKIHSNGFYIGASYILPLHF